MDDSSFECSDDLSSSYEEGNSSNVRALRERLQHMTNQTLGEASAAAAAIKCDEDEDYDGDDDDSDSDDDDEEPPTLSTPGRATIGGASDDVDRVRNADQSPTHYGRRSAYPQQPSRAALRADRNPRPQPLPVAMEGRVNALRQSIPATAHPERNALLTVAHPNSRAPAIPIPAIAAVISHAPAVPAPAGQRVLPSSPKLSRPRFSSRRRVTSNSVKSTPVRRSGASLKRKITAYDGPSRGSPPVIMGRQVLVSTPGVPAARKIVPCRASRHQNNASIMPRHPAVAAPAPPIMPAEPPPPVTPLPQPGPASRLSPLTMNVACIICFDRIADTVLLPCRHLVICELCANSGWESGGNGAKCPVCRCLVEGRGVNYGRGGGYGEIG